MSGQVEMSDGSIIDSATGPAPDVAWLARPSVRERRPSIHTDALESSKLDCKGIVVLGGAIKWWWQASCLTCGHWDEADIMRGQRCPAGSDKHNTYVWWNSPEHRVYCAWRDAVRAMLIEEGYLTYAPWMAFKGTWDERAQFINDAVIATADVFVVLSPTYAITEGTDEECEVAARLRKPIIHAHAPARDEVRLMLPALQQLKTNLAAVLA